MPHLPLPESPDVGVTILGKDGNRINRAPLSPDRPTLPPTYGGQPVTRPPPLPSVVTGRQGAPLPPANTHPPPPRLRTMLC